MPKLLPIIDSARILGRETVVTTNDICQQFLSHYTVW